MKTRTFLHCPCYITHEHYSTTTVYFLLTVLTFDLVHMTSVQNKASRKPVAVNNHQLTTRVSQSYMRQSGVLI